MDIKKLPKIELHCHLDGSLRIETAVELAKKEKIEIESYRYEYVKELLSIGEECTSLDDYLTKFYLPNSLMQSSENLKRIAYELLEDASKENVKYMEVRFAPILHTQNGLTLKEVIKAVVDGIKKAELDFDIKGNAIISCMRSMSLDHVYDSIEAGKDFIGQGVSAIDLAAVENKGFAVDYVDAINLAKGYGYKVTIHAGETGFAENVIDAINLLGAERIGHGFYIYKSKEAYDLVKEKGVTLEVCPKSNIDTKAADSYKNHPFYKYYKDGINISISTDNRTVSNITLSEELESIFNTFDLTLDEYNDIYCRSVKSAFCDDKTKEWLLTFVN